MVAAWGAGWRCEEKGTEAEWKGKREDFVTKVAKEWGVRGLLGKEDKEERKRRWEEGRRKEEKKEDDDEAGKKEYRTHPNDRKWTGVGCRAKLVVDNQATANTLNRKTACRNYRLEK